MPLTPGSRLGAYEIVAAVGAGGMGEVYRARDTTLHRDVAIKTLPDLFAGDPERLARFAREAQTLAALNHPNIAHIYGLEGAALVMEFVDGEDLGERLSREPIPLDEALPIARQIVDALEAAHDQGIIHRDLKPANIKVRPDGTVKVLDFGLAKALELPTAAAGSRPSQAQLAHSPTMTSPPAMTQMGMVLGTAAYMSPEQAKGKPVDKRADVWAFGCVLYEMLTGTAVFPGDNVTEILAAVVRGEPDWASLPADTPPALHRLLRRCLTKDVKDRLSDIGVARLEIRDAADVPRSGEAVATLEKPRRAIGPWWALGAALLGGLLAAGLGAWMLWPTSRVLPPLSLTIDWPDGLTWVGPSGPGIAVSPDGTHVAYIASSNGEPPRLYLRDLRDDQTRPMPGSDRAYNPFFSPDGAQVGFISGGKLWRAPISGGAPFEIASVDQGDRGVAWSPDGSLYVGGGSGVYRIAEAGGTREALTSVDHRAGEVAHRFPAVVPGGRGILFTVFKGSLEEARVALLDLTTKKWRVVMDRAGHAPIYVPTGHLVYLRNDVLMAAPFDASRLEVTGASLPVMNGILYNSGGAGHFGLAATGTLVYVSDSGRRPQSELVWIDRSGRMTPIDTPRGAYGRPAISPDGTRVALERSDPPTKLSIIVWDFGRQAFSTVTRDAGINEFPMWMPDGERLIVTSRPQPGAAGRLFQLRADGTSTPTQMTTGTIEQKTGTSREIAGSVSSDGLKLMYSEFATATDAIRVLDLASKQVQNVGTARGAIPRLSPDGRWLAYRSAESGIAEIYISPYPNVSSGRSQISTGGGYSPRWSHDGRELFYRGIGANRSQMFAVTLGPGATMGGVRPQVLFEIAGAADADALADFDVARDGRFLMLRPSETKPPIPHVIVNWLEVLKRTVPVAR